MNNARGILGRILVCAAAALGLCGCINMEWETFLNPDLSGVITIDTCGNKEALVSVLAGDREGGQKSRPAPGKAPADYDVTLPEAAFLPIFDPGAIRNKAYWKAEKGGVMHAYFKFEFSDIRKIFRDSGKNVVIVSRDASGRVLLSQRLRPFGDDKNQNNPPGVNEVLDKMLKVCSFTYTLHLSRGIVSANSTEVVGHKAVWRIPMDEFLKKDSVLTAVMRPQDRFLGWYYKVFEKKQTW